jgi:UDP-N-acetylmuramate--alanine ligase
LKKIHFIGIGGIGLSALARFLKHQGYIVSGSDMSSTKITKALVEEGICVNVPHDQEAIKDQDIIVCSAVIKEDNPEVLRAVEKGIKVVSRKEALKFILEDKKVYAVAGAHGKSTTSAILASILKETMLIGAESKEFETNMHFVKSDTVVFEADESDESFLNSNPYIAIVTNAEPEHMEYYSYDYDRFFRGYQVFLQLANIRVINAEDAFLSLLEIECDRLFPSKEIKNIHTMINDNEPYTCFELRDLGEFCVWGIGEHIALDASLAIIAANHLIDIETIRKNIKDFRGIKKRFDILESQKEYILIDDYAHHPTEIEATMQSAKEYAKLMCVDNITAIWQPHKYSRTLDNLEGFIESFEGVNRLIILPVWRAGEKEVEIDFAKHFMQYNPIFADKIQTTQGDIALIKDGAVIQNITDGLVIGFGAGDITYQLRGVK